MPAGPHSPLPPTIADRDAEIAALQTAFDEYIASSRELEDELDAELAKMQEKLAESSAANAALIGQLESINPQLSSLERALAETKSKLEGESNLRRQAELAQDEAESRAREAEGALEALRAENDDLHEQLAFREEEVEEMKLELEVEKERHTVELDELAAQLSEVSKRKWVNGNGVSPDGYAEPRDDSPVGEQSGKKQKDSDNVSVMSEDDFVNMAVGSADGVANDDQEDYIKRLEDELEDVTEQLIDAETRISQMEGKLASSEKSKLESENNVVQLEQKIAELQESLANKVDKSLVQDDALKEEITLLTEELALTQEELKAAEEDSKASAALIEQLKADNKKELQKLQLEIDEAKGSAKSARMEVESLTKALSEAAAATTPLREEVESLETALSNAKRDHEKSMEEMQALRQAFDEQEVDVREASEAREAEMTTSHKRQLDDLQAQIDHLESANKQLKVSQAAGDAIAHASVEQKIKMEQMENELTRAKKEVENTKADLEVSKRKIAELTAATKYMRTFSSMAENSSNKKFKSFNLPNIVSDDEDDSRPTSEFYRSHARSRTRTCHSGSRARSSSPSTIDRLECSFFDSNKKMKKLSKECETLRQQNRMSDVRVQHLETDVANLQNQVSNAVVPIVIQNPNVPEYRDDADVFEVDIEDLITSGNTEKISEELRAMTRRASAQKEHNAQLLTRILNLQGNIQVCARIRPLSMSEMQQGRNRVVENLSETEVGCFDSRTKTWKSYVFDKVWGPDSSQLGIFQDVEPLALSVIDGYNACIFAYGQTGSGKTFTMEGGEKSYENGISFRTVEKVISLLRYRQAQQTILAQKYAEAQKIHGSNTSAMPLSGNPTAQFKYSIIVGVLEIYNDNVHDLLVVSKNKNQKKQSLEIKRDKNGQIDVADLIKEKVHSLQDVTQLLNRAKQNRATAATDLNEHSSRSHMVLTVELCCGLEGEEPTRGKLLLVDLAGSERVRKSAVEGDALKEASHINKSLSALGNVMEALDRKASHVPYRDSKLTYLLQDSLGGNSRTMMVVTVCPTAETYDETQYALQFATRVRRIHLGSAKRNVTSKNLEETVKALSTELRMLSKAKEKSESQLQTLKRDHNRIQERLHRSSESRANTVDETRTLSVLKSNNEQMTQRWQKEKSMHEKTSLELENTQNALKDLQHELNKAARENSKLSKLVQEKENELFMLQDEVRNHKDAAYGANLRARKSQLLHSRPSQLTSPTGASPAKRSSTIPSTMDATEAREQVLAMLKEHDPTKVDKVDAIMERFQGRESFLLMKMKSRYETTNNVSSSASVNSKSSQSNKRPGTASKRSEMALARHMERMRSKKGLD